MYIYIYVAHLFLQCFSEFITQIPSLQHHPLQVLLAVQTF